jgi:putative membrane protein
MEPSTFGLVLNSLGTGLPLLLLHFLTTLALLGLGIACYMGITPFHERRMIAEGNAAAGVVLAGTLVALAIPLAATLASSLVLLDIVIWGLVALALQLITFAVSALLIRELRTMIEAGNIAAASTLVGIQLAIALLNAGAMAG